MNTHHYIIVAGDSNLKQESPAPPITIIYTDTQDIRTQ